MTSLLGSRSTCTSSWTGTGERSARAVERGVEPVVELSRVQALGELVQVGDGEDEVAYGAGDVLVPTCVPTERAGDPDHLLLDATAHASGEPPAFVLCSQNEAVAGRGHLVELKADLTEQGGVCGRQAGRGGDCLHESRLVEHGGIVGQHGKRPPCSRSIDVAARPVPPAGMITRAPV